METKGFFQFEIIVKVLVSSSRFNRIPTRMFCVSDRYTYVYSYSVGSTLEILTSKVYQRDVRVECRSRLYSGFYLFFWHIAHHLLDRLKIKCDINQQDCKTVDLRSA